MKTRLLALLLAVMLMGCALSGAAEDISGQETPVCEEASGEGGSSAPETPDTGKEAGPDAGGAAVPGASEEKEAPAAETVGGPTPEPSDETPTEPAVVTTEEPTTETPKETTTVTTEEPTTETPEEPTTGTPEEPATVSPEESTTETPGEPTTEIPEEPTTETPGEPVTETPAEPTTETPGEPATETPEEPITETPEEPITETPGEPTTETPAEPTTETPKEPATETPKEPVTETPEEPTTETPEEPTTETPEEPTTETPEQPAEGSGEEAGEWRPAAGDEAWMANPEGEPPFVGGKLEDLLEALRDRSGEFTVYLCSEGVMRATGFDMDEDLTGITFDVDPVIFQDREMTIFLSNEDPTGAPAGEEITLYVWLEEKKDEPVSEPTPEPETEPTPTPEPEGEPEGETTPEPTPEPTVEPLRVTAECGTYQPDTWVSQAHRFKVSGIPEGQEGYYYAAIVYDERIAVLSADTFTAREEGKYSVQFAICDAIGDIQCVSDTFVVQQDYTPPVWLSVTLREDSKTSFDMYAEDELSGVAYYSFDGGESWIQPDEDGKVTGSGKKGEIFEIGTLLVKDAAGNVSMYPEPFEIPGGGGGGWYGGGGSGGGGDKKSFVHSPSGSGGGKKASGGANIEKKYGSFAREAVEEAVEQLTIDGDPLQISVENPELTEEQYGPRFLAEFTVWEKDAADDEKADTLILTLEKGEDDGEDARYVWKLNGAAYRLLYKGGVKYLVLSEGDRICALSTAGFTAGTEYTRLMRLGTSASQFDYTIELVDKDEEELDAEDPVDWKAKIGVTVQPGEEDGEVLSFELAGESGTPMYYYDVHCGGKEIFDTPFEKEEEGQ